MQSFMVILVFTATIGLTHCCKSNDECPDNSSCNEEEVCSCSQGYLFSSDKSKCLPYVTEYFGVCSEVSQCEWLGDSSTVECNYVCKCKDGYRWYLGQCSPYVGLGDKCTQDQDCYDGYNLQSMTCQENVCKCNNNYYEREGTDCRRISPLTGECAWDIDCPNIFGETVCVVGKCQTKTNNNFLQAEEIKQTNFGYGKTSAISCDKNCEEIPNSECYDKTGTCICKKQYFFNEDASKCIPEVGVEIGCTKNEDCPIKPGRCENGVCYCRDYYFVDDGNRNCVKTMIQTNWNCVSKEWCYALGKYAYCTSNGTCQCSKIAEYDAEISVCKQTDEPDPDMCAYDYECMYIRNGYCVDEACGCKSGYVLNDGTCFAELGVQCDDEIPCAADSAQCEEGVCQCRQGYVPFEKACYSKADELGNDCTVDAQCTASVVYSKCVDRECKCDDDHIPYNNDTCYSKTDFGSYCNNLLECSLSLSDTMDVESIKCRNHLCQCPTGYTKKDNKCSSGSFTAGSFFFIATILLLKGLF